MSNVDSLIHYCSIHNKSGSSTLPDHNSMSQSKTSNRNSGIGVKFKQQIQVHMLRCSLRHSTYTAEQNRTETQAIMHTRLNRVLLLLLHGRHKTSEGVKVCCGI